MPAIPFQFYSSTFQAHQFNILLRITTSNHTKPLTTSYAYSSSSSSSPSYLSKKLLRSHMGLSQTRAKTATTIIMALFFLAFFSILLFHKDNITQWTSSMNLSMLPLLCVVVVFTLGLVVAAARATVLTWITVLVLLAFAGNRRRILVKRGRTITNDVAMFLIGVLVKERGLIAVACATIFSLVAVIGIKEAQASWLM